MPVAARDLNGLHYYAWAFSAFLIGMLFATVVCGRISDRVGPAKPLLAGLMIFLAGLVVSGTAQHMAQLVFGRLVQGLGSGAMNVAIFVCVAQVYSTGSGPRSSSTSPRVGRAIVCGAACFGMADQQFELALGLLRCHSTGSLRRHHGVAKPAANDASVSRAAAMPTKSQRRYGLPGCFVPPLPLYSSRVSGSTGLQLCC
jgi:hypothetical protein